MENTQKQIILPDIERATKDLEEYERRYQVSFEKLRKISNEVENLKVQKQTLKADIVEKNKILQYYSKLHVETASKIQNAIIRCNKAKLMELSNVEKIKQTEAAVIGNKINTYDFDIYDNIRSQTSQELIRQKATLEQTTLDNNRYMEDILKKFKLKD